MGKRIVNHPPVVTIFVGGIYKPYPVDWVGKKHGSSEAPGCCPETDLAVLASAPSHARQELRGLGEVMEGPGLLMSKKWKVTHQNRVYYICLLCMFTIYVFFKPHISFYLSPLQKHTSISANVTRIPGKSCMGFRTTPIYTCVLPTITWDQGHLPGPGTILLDNNWQSEPIEALLVLEGSTKTGWFYCDLEQYNVYYNK